MSERDFADYLPSGSGKEYWDSELGSQAPSDNAYQATSSDAREKYFEIETGSTEPPTGWGYIVDELGGWDGPVPPPKQKPIRYTGRYGNAVRVQRHKEVNDNPYLISKYRAEESKLHPLPTKIKFTDEDLEKMGKYVPRTQLPHRWSKAMKKAKKVNDPRQHPAYLSVNPMMDPSYAKKMHEDPMMSAPKLLSHWNDDALAGVWNAQKDKLKDLPQVTLQLRAASQLPAMDFYDCLAIVEYTSKAHYRASEKGWNEREKTLEMKTSRMLYILVRAAGEQFSTTLDTAGDIIGFISFMVDQDDPPRQDRRVIYIYEVHIGDNWRGKGLGKFLMFTVEAMAGMISINKTMLTVFMANQKAIKAYEKMGYTKDKSSPGVRRTRRRVVEPTYMIMSKVWREASGELIEDEAVEDQNGEDHNIGDQNIEDEFIEGEFMKG